ncbi:hypothetical protein ACIRS1_11275 [Kitasatospora sp. NPDC101176]|uniref:hypothetical protein n=1 Tax=Kitasatospora sp. NPDC101176 TaxID=3364099 RepID=UPI0037FC732E
MAVQRWLVLTVLTTALTGLTAPALAADPDPGSDPAAAAPVTAPVTDPSAPTDPGPTDPAPTDPAPTDPVPVTDPVPPATAVTIGDVLIDPKIPGRVRFNVGYLCGVAGGARSLTVSVEQKDPEDSSSIAFGSSRTAEADVVCDGTPQQRQLIVQSKTVNWIPGAPAMVIATVADIGSTPPASADARAVNLAVAPAPAS